MSSWEYRARTRWTRRIALERVAGGAGQEQRHLKRRGAVGAVYTDALGRVDPAHDMGLSRAVWNAAAFAEGGGRVSSCRINHWDTVTPPRNVRIEGLLSWFLEGMDRFQRSARISSPVAVGDHSARNARCVVVQTKAEGVVLGEDATRAGDWIKRRQHEQYVGVVGVSWMTQRHGSLLFAGRGAARREALVGVFRRT